MRPLAMPFFIEPSQRDLEIALQSWRWIGLEGKTPVRVTAFGDVFFTDEDGSVWFLDGLEGSMKPVFANVREMERALATEEGQDEYLLAGFVIRAETEGMVLQQGECYDWKLNPAVGGAVEFSNVHKSSFVVALNVSGQIHEHNRRIPPGTRISGFRVDGAKPPSE